MPELFGIVEWLQRPVTYDVTDMIEIVFGRCAVSNCLPPARLVSLRRGLDEPKVLLSVRRPSGVGVAKQAAVRAAVASWGKAISHPSRSEAERRAFANTS